MSNKFYVYLPQTKLKNVMKYGYLSVKDQIKLSVGSMRTIYDKYITQTKHWLGGNEDDSLIDYHLSTLNMDEKIKLILNYLNWRSFDQTGKYNGADAVYLLFKPLNEYAYNKLRGTFFAEARVLLEVEIPSSKTLYIVTPDKNVGSSVESYMRKEPDYWNKLWLARKDDYSLWFNGIPHLFVIGSVVPSKIKKLDYLFI